MSKTWKLVKSLWMLVAALALVLLGVALCYGYLDGSIDGLRAGLKLMAVVGLLFWLYERWTLLGDR